MKDFPRPVSKGDVGPLLEVVVRSAPNGIIVAEESGKIALVNRKAEELFGYGQDEFSQLRLEDLIPGRTRKRHTSFRTEFQRSPSARQMGAGRELLALRKGGVEFPAEVGLSPVEVNGKQMIVASVIDVSQRKLAEEAIRLQAEILNNVHDAVFLADPEGVIKSWNAGAEEVYGFRADEAVGANVRIFLPEEDRDRYVRMTYPWLLEQGHCDFVSWSVHKSGKRIAVAVRARLLRRATGEPEGAVICANDITQQKLLEQKVIEVSENEQRRIGQDIHDDLCQQLASIGCFTKVVQQRLKERSDVEADHLAQIGEMISQANVRAREIARDLVPSIVESEGLPGALEELAERTEQAFRLECRFECPEQLRLPSQAAVQLYRIAQEAVGNAVRHGKPKTLTVALSRKSDRLTLSISDDGQGMPKKQGSSGLGLLTMAHRAQMLDGDFSVHTKPGRGTRIECTVPYPFRMLGS